MNSQLLEFDRLLLILFAFLLVKVSWKLYASPAPQLEKCQSTPALALETSLAQ
ncbi:hypothetical protein KFU94_54615 [Chloroflexi bacterium TSY]|nr:hypothetical protein [Chloroflexi bacterium TSY]